MNLEKIISDIDAMTLYPITQKSVAALLELNRLNKLIYGDAVYAGCSNCHIKAFKLLKALTLEDLKIMTESKFKIKKDHLIEWPYRGGSFYHANAPMTNEVAAGYLKKHPEKLEQFEVYPGSEEDVPVYKPLTAAAKIDVPLADMDKKQLQAEYLKVFQEKPKSKDTAKDLLDAIQSKLASDTVQAENEEPSDEEPGDEEPGDEEPGDEEPGDEEPGDEEPGDEDLDDLN